MLTPLSLGTWSRILVLTHALSLAHLPVLWRFGEPPGETLELAAVFCTVMISLGIMVLLGWWWQR